MYTVNLTLENKANGNVIEHSEKLQVKTCGATLPYIKDENDKEIICKEALTNPSLIDNKTVKVKSVPQGVWLNLTNNGSEGQKDAYTNIHTLPNGKCIYMRVEFKIAEPDEFNFKSPTNSTTQTSKDLENLF